MFRFALATVLLATGSLAPAQSRSDREAVEMLPRHFVEAWAKHDGHALSQILADDSDFVNVGGVWLHGKKDFETYHSRLLSNRFRDAQMTLLELKSNFVRRDLGVVRWSWSMVGDRNPNGSTRPPRAGLMTMLAEKRGGVWKVIAAQNTNAGPGKPPELEGIIPPISLPNVTP